MPEQRNIPVFRPGAGDVANGSVDYYPMDWEIVGREDQPAAGRARSGCGCAASIGCGYLMRQLELGKLHNVLFLATGALMSTVSCQQGCSIPCISHLVYLSTDPTPVFQGGGR